ncbi:DUF4349 domain-containing protein [Massilia pseudoviolaceinigra]|uniref:DUF4349 domain-containing protein n=1 Tax=Massilia pseudoviolaceinigra TaxID=3057165 RepID=UPI002796C505|nr:DUF4349 domain-containing protein [Massilia sp. CCM 9206]MDQ1920303.1 DUF4349 domain-containing protein [Massilia sp. CCM 9206]
MMYLKPVKRAAGCLTLLALLAACSKKEEMGSLESPAVAPVADSVAVPAAAPPPPAPSARARAANEAAPSVSAQAAYEVAPASPAKALATASAGQQMAGGASTYTDNERKFIRTASAHFRVKDVYVAALGIEDTVAGHGGFVVKNDISTESTNTQRHPGGDGKLIELSEYTVQAHLIVRVPSAKTQEFLRAIAGHVVFLDERKYAAHDAQFDVLRQQLQAMRDQETQNELGDAVRDGGKLVQKTDAIAMRSDVKATRDAALLAKKEFEDRVAFSTIDLTLLQPSRVLQSERVDVDSVYRQYRPGFATQLRDQLRGGWEGMLTFFLALAGLWPLLLIAAASGMVLRRFLRRQKKAVAPE